MGNKETILMKLVMLYDRNAMSLSTLVHYKARFLFFFRQLWICLCVRIWRWNAIKMLFRRFFFNATLSHRFHRYHSTFVIIPIQYKKRSLLNNLQNTFPTMNNIIQMVWWRSCVDVVIFLAKLHRYRAEQRSDCYFIP